MAPLVKAAGPPGGVKIRIVIDPSYTFVAGKRIIYVPAFLKRPPEQASSCG